MKLLMKLSMLLLLFGVSATAALAQYDDVYYDPERNTNRTYTERRQVQPKTTPAQTEEYVDENYDDEEYDYYYTSRIRRFHRPYAGFNYFDPIYVDAYYYDAFARPGVTVLIYDDPFGYYGYNRMSRFNRWNGWAYGGWNRFNRFNSWNSWGNYDPYSMWSNPGLSFGFGRWNSFGFNNWNSFGYGFGGSYWGNSWFNTPTWGNNYYYNNTNYYTNNQGENNRNIYNGPRTGGGGVGSQPGIDNPNGRSPRFTDSDIKSNPGTVRPDYSGGRKLDEAPSYDRDRTVPGNGNPRVTTDPNREVLGTPNSTDRYRDARESLNRPSNETRRPETADPFSGGRRIDNSTNNGARTYTDDRQNLRPNTTQDPYNSRPRSYEPAPRSTDNSSLDRSRTYTPDRSYERSRSTDTYSAPRNSSPSNSGSGYSRPSYDSGRSNGLNNSGSSSAPRSFDGGGSRPSAGGSNPSPSSSGSSGSSSSGGRSSSSGGRQN